MSLNTKVIISDLHKTQKRNKSSFLERKLYLQIDLICNKNINIIC